jgi:hypothetical protein
MVTGTVVSVTGRQVVLDCADDQQVTLDVGQDVFVKLDGQASQVGMLQAGDRCECHEHADGTLAVLKVRRATPDGCEASTAPGSTDGTDDFKRPQTTTEAQAELESSCVGIEHVQTTIHRHNESPTGKEDHTRKPFRPQCLEASDAGRGVGPSLEQITPSLGVDLMKTMHVDAGDHIREACRKALELAVASNETVQFEFNERTITAEPTSTIGDLYGQWGRPVLTAEQEREANTAALEKMKREQAEAIEKAGAATEAELRDMKEPWPRSIEELTGYIQALTNRPHDYGTCCHAMSLAAVAAFNFVAHELGTTGFQAGCAQMDFLRRQRHLNHGFQLIDYERLLYPQYVDELTITPEKLLENPDVRKLVVEAARKHLAESHEGTHPEVRKHWEKLSNLELAS